MRHAFLALSLLLGAPALATTVVAQDVEELALDSTAVIEAVVGPRETFRGGDQFYSDIALDVREVHAGAAPKRVVLRQFGGQIDGEGAQIPGDARLAEGDHVIAFVRVVDGHWYLTSLGQSVWHVGTGPDQPVTRDLDGLTFFERAFDGSIRPAMQSLPEYETRDQLVRAVRGLPMGQGGGR